MIQCKINQKVTANSISNIISKLNNLYQNYYLNLKKTYSNRIFLYSFQAIVNFLDSQITHDYCNYFHSSSSSSSPYYYYYYYYYYSTSFYTIYRGIVSLGGFYEPRIGEHTQLKGFPDLCSAE